MKGSCYISVVNETIARAWNSQQEKIAAAAEQIAEAIKRKNNVFTLLFHAPAKDFHYNIFYNSKI